MTLSDLLVSYNQVKAPTIHSQIQLPAYNIPTYQEQEKEEKKEEQQEESKYKVSRELFKKKSNDIVRGSQEFEDAYDRVEKINPEAKKYRKFLTKMAQQESGFNKSIQNREGAPAYGYFQFMQDGKKYNNISTYAGTDIETFKNNPDLQIQAAIKLAKSFENGFNESDKKLAKEKGFTVLGLLGGAWLGGVGGVRKYLQGKGNPSDRHWSKEGKGTSVGDRIRMFNFKYGGKL